MKICSACLLGIKCRYDAQSKPNKEILKLAKEELLIPVCPEQLGGLATPRPAAEIKKGKVITKRGIDVTKNFKEGAKEVLRMAKIYNIKEAILKQRSPSCGCGEVYDGSFSGNVIKGDGVLATLLKKNKIKILTEDDF